MDMLGMFHYDLDGVGCDILSSKVFKFNDKYCGGYWKIHSFIEEGRYKGHDAIFIADLSLTIDQYELINEEYKNRFIYVDHHESSKIIYKIFNVNKKIAIIDDRMSATALIYMNFHDKMKGVDPNFVSAIDAYDMWRFQTHPKEFENGYNLNILFKRYGYFDFRELYGKNPVFHINNDDMEYITEYRNKRDAVIKNTETIVFDNSYFKSIVIFCEDTNFINDYSLYYHDKGIDIFYIIYYSDDGNYRLSIRTNSDSFNISQSLNDCTFGDNKEWIHDFGGHKSACGIGFEKNIDLKTILEIIESIDESLEIPF